MDGGLKFVHGYPQSSKLGPLLAQVQAEETDSGDLGWGLRLEHEALPDVERGFMGCRWPTQRRRNTDWTMGKKAITYVEGGRLIQATAIANKFESVVGWKLGGKVQFTHQDPIPDTEYTINSTCKLKDGVIIHVLCVQNRHMCVDVQLFLNGVSYNLQLDEIQPEDTKTTFADMTCSGSQQLDWGNPEVFVTVFTLRDSRKQAEPEYFRGPSWSAVEDHLCLSIWSRKVSKTIDFGLDSKKDQLSHLPPLSLIALRNAEQLLSVAVLPNIAEVPRQVQPLIDEVAISNLPNLQQTLSGKFHLMNNFAEHDRPKMNCEATL
jgi:hypothetical protein